MLTTFKNNDTQLSFIDLFAGIGGFHLAMHRNGVKCVFASEWDKFARLTYEANFKYISPSLFQNNRFLGDITKVDAKDIPDFDILTAGFPCQPFSMAGKRKGFEDSRGTMFFEIARIISIKKPKAYFLENVRGLLSHDKGKTFALIKKTLENLGYSFYWKVVKACDFGLPQLRPRVFLVGFRDRTIKFDFPVAIPLIKTLDDVFKGKCNRKVAFTICAHGYGSKITDRRNWCSYLVNGKVRKMNVEEAKELMGFPKRFQFPVSKTQALKQLGNSVAVNAVSALARKIVDFLAKH